MAEATICPSCKNDYAQRLREGVPPGLPKEKHGEEVIQSLHYGSTWKLVGLGIITYGIYYAHYIKRQTTILNQSLPEDRRIRDSFPKVILGASYLSLVLVIAYFIVDDSTEIDAASSAVDSICNILILVWGFKARNRMNECIKADPKSKRWFNGLLTFFLTPLYFNYKINKLNEE
ncbi:MAG: DUF4234 domain-containing protein [Puniceicoccales bacterium]